MRKPQGLWNVRGWTVTRVENAQDDRTRCGNRNVWRMDVPVLKGNGERLLVVDDEATIREVIAMTLEFNGYQCRTAEDGTDAFAVYLQERERIAAVITDLNMARMDGITLVRGLRILSPALKVIVSSGHICSEKQRVLEALGVRRLLAKPYTMETLLRCVRDTLDDREGACSIPRQMAGAGV